MDLFPRKLATPTSTRKRHLKPILRFLSIYVGVRESTYHESLEVCMKVGLD